MLKGVKKRTLKEIKLDIKLRYTEVKKMARVRNWCFTAWEKLDWESMITGKCTYIIVGEEICPETKKVHYQGYAEFSDGITLSACKKLFGNDVHFEKRMGTQEQAITYCKKDGKWEEFGELKQQGKRTDLDKCRSLIKEGKKNYEIVEEVTSFQAVKSLDTLRYMMIRPRDKNVKPTVHWIYGPTGTGKTVKAKEILGEYDDCDFVNNFLIGYTGNKCVLFDDYRGGIPLHKLLTMLDYGQCTVNVKNGSCFFGAETIVFTAPFRPEEIYKNTKGENIKQLLRRIDILTCTEEGTQKSGGNTRPPPRRYALESDESDDEEI